MTDLNKIASVYLVGIGGIGMSALARFFKSRGAAVRGYDKTTTPLTKRLAEEGIEIHFEENVQAIPKEVDLVVYTPAIPADHKELKYYREHGYNILKRSEVLQLITESSFNICVAGTHGKTTISTMIAHILKHSRFGCNAFLGGISVNYNSNFWSSESDICVIEADEYDRSFLKLSPNIAVITAMDADHLDIYGTEEFMENAYVEFTGRLKEGGRLYSKYGLKRQGDFKAEYMVTYSLDNGEADAHATDLRVMNGAYCFNVIMKDWSLENVQLNIGGLHNVENAVVAIAVARQLGIGGDKIIEAVAAFKGVKRRFEYIIPPGDQCGKIMIDDYAHHPVELKALINGVKNLFGDKKMTMVFQPHLYTRTRDLAKDFAQSLDLADEVILLPIYPARELPVEGVSSKLIYDEMKNTNKNILTKKELKEYMQKNKPDLVVTAGAGDIDAELEEIKTILVSN